MKYTFICECKAKFEKELSVSEYSKQKEFRCPKCGSISTSRVYNSTAVIFKGSGFTKSIVSDE